jgi:hypothetical protein
MMPFLSSRLLFLFSGKTWMAKNRNLINRGRISMHKKLVWRSKTRNSYTGGKQRNLTRGERIRLLENSSTSLEV